MSPAAQAQPAVKASGEAQEALAESKARSVISYSPDEIFQKSWQVRKKKKKRKEDDVPPSRSCLFFLRPRSIIIIKKKKKTRHASHHTQQTYQLVVDVGLLGHAKVAWTVASRLGELRRSRGRPLRVLDLGSGDAGSLTRALAAEAAALFSSSPSSSSSSSSAAAAASEYFIAQYTGVDESRPALALAAENVRRHLPGTEGRFFVGDFLAAAQRSSGDGGAAAASAAAAANPSSSSSDSKDPFPAPPEGGYDAVLASLSAHHLSTEEGKPALVAAARRALSLPPPTPRPPAGGGEGEGKEEGSPSSSSPPPSGSSLLIIADVFLNDDGDDSVDAWRRRSCAVIREQWPLRVPGGALSREEADRIAGHVGTCDIPTTVSKYASFAQSAGFRSCEKVADVEEELGIRVVVMEA